MEQPQEFDDPNTTISNILDRLRRFGVTIDFAPSKLKQGYGEQALFVLDRLSDEALRATQFTWSQPEAPEEEAKEDEEMEDDAEVLLDRVEEDMAGETSDEEEEDILHIDDFKSYHQNKVDSSLSERIDITTEGLLSRREKEAGRGRGSGPRRSWRAPRTTSCGGWRWSGWRPASRSPSRARPGTGGRTSSRCISTGTGGTSKHKLSPYVLFINE